MTGETDLNVLLESMSPTVRPGEFVFVSLSDDPPAGVTVHASVREVEGLTVVLDRADADRLGLSYDFVAGWITLEVHSALEAVRDCRRVPHRRKAASSRQRPPPSRPHPPDSGCTPRW
jgi:hypothetical protein